MPVKPQGTAELNAANPLVFGHAFSNETPHMDTWQVSYERQLTNTLMAEIAYAGSKGRTSSGSATSTRSSRGRARRPRAGSSSPSRTWSTINYFDPNNRSIYNGLQVKLNQRFSRGLQYLASYTFGKSLDYAGSPPRAAARWAGRRA